MTISVRSFEIVHRVYQINQNRLASHCDGRKDKHIKAKKVIGRVKRSKTLSEVKPFENISKNQ